MRILHVAPSFGFGGMEKIICAVIQHTTKNNNTHTILALDGDGRAREWIKQSDVQMWPFTKNSSRHLFFKDLFFALRKAQPDLLMTYNWGSTDAIWLGRLAGISKIIHHEHGFNIDESISTTWRRDMIRLAVYHLASRIVVVSQELETLLREKFRVSEAQISRISNGVDTSYYSPNDIERQRVRASLGYRSSDIVLGFAGRLDPVKNLDLLVGILECSNPRDYPFRLLIVGDGPDRSRIEKRCHAVGIAPYVNFVGEQTDIRPYLLAMDVFLLTSLREQMPLTVLEAMAVGIPVIATNVGEIPYIIDHGINGFLQEARASPEVFVQALRSVLCPSQRKSLGDAARKKAVSHFKLDTMVRKYTSLIREVGA
jgi:sugar transferase (PEP-CTERM/EpsH1 system associated)